jgi:hypothetical protein
MGVLIVCCRYIYIVPNELRSIDLWHGEWWCVTYVQVGVGVCMVWRHETLPNGCGGTTHPLWMHGGGGGGIRLQEGNEGMICLGWRDVQI